MVREGCSVRKFRQITDEIREFEGSIRITLSFADGTLHLDDPVHEKGHFRGQGVDVTGFVHEKGRFSG